MQDDVSPETAPEEGAGETAAAEETAGQPERRAARSPSGTVEAVSDGPTAAEGEEAERLDPQLIVLCVVLWLAACAIFVFQWEGMRVDWHLGNLKELLAYEKRLDKFLEHDSAVTLIEMGPEVVPKLAEELRNPNQKDQKFRAALVRLVERVPGPESFELLKALASDDYNPGVRGNAYLALGARAGQGTEQEKEATLQVVVSGLLREPHPVARAFAADVLGRLGDLRAGWPLILALRDLDGKDWLITRQSCLNALRHISKLDDKALPFDVDAPLAKRDEGIAAWEDWFEKAGGAIPKGEDVKSARARQAKAEKDEQPGRRESVERPGAEKKTE